MEVTKPSYINAITQQHRIKEGETLHKVRNKIQEYGLDEVAKVRKKQGR